MVAGQVGIAEALAALVADKRASLARLKLRNLGLGVLVVVFLGVICFAGLDLVERLVLLMLEPLKRALNCKATS